VELKRSFITLTLDVLIILFIWSKL